MLLPRVWKGLPIVLAATTGTCHSDTTVRLVVTSDPRFAAETTVLAGDVPAPGDALVVTTRDAANFPVAFLFDLPSEAPEFTPPTFHARVTMAVTEGVFAGQRQAVQLYVKYPLKEHSLENLVFHWVAGSGTGEGARCGVSVDGCDSFVRDGECVAVCDTPSIDHDSAGHADARAGAPSSGPAPAVRVRDAAVPVDARADSPEAAVDAMRDAGSDASHASPDPCADAQPDACVVPL